MERIKDQICVWEDVVAKNNKNNQMFSKDYNLVVYCTKVDMVKFLDWKRYVSD